LEDKQALRVLHVQLDRNSGSPTSREAHGDGVPIVLVGVTPYQGAWESQVQGKGGQVLRQISQEVVREHLCSITSELERLLRTGEPDALKGARPVRRGAVGNVLS
jgi:hypothetical protein